MSHQEHAELRTDDRSDNSESLDVMKLLDLQPADSQTVSRSVNPSCYTSYQNYQISQAARNKEMLTPPVASRRVKLSIFQLK